MHPLVDRVAQSTAPELFGVHIFDVRGAAKVPAVATKGEALGVPWEGPDRDGPKKQNLKIDLNF